MRGKVFFLLKSWATCENHCSKVTVDPAAPSWSPQEFYLMNCLLFPVFPKSSWFGKFGVGRTSWDVDWLWGGEFPWAVLKWESLSWEEKAQQVLWLDYSVPQPWGRGALRQMTHHEFWVWREEKRCLCPCVSVYLHARTHRLLSPIPLVPQGLLCWGFQLSLLIYDERGAMMLFAGCLFNCRDIITTISPRLGLI